MHNMCAKELIIMPVNDQGPRILHAPGKHMIRTLRQSSLNSMVRLHRNHRPKKKKREIQILGGRNKCYRKTVPKHAMQKVFAEMLPFIRIAIRNDSKAKAIHSGVSFSESESEV